MKKHLYILCIAAFCLTCQLVFGYTLDWTANCVNQYTQFTHDADGNMLSDGNLTYTYDAANRLKTVSSNGVLLVTNFYDAKSRRVKKVTPEATTTVFYDGWNLIEERIAYTNGTTSTIHYYWGKDLSGTLQGAGGVGGLLYLTIDGVPYIPDYDNIGNITRCLDVNGNVVAQYTYDAFGGTLSQSGSLANMFRHRFSTKYYDAETGLYYYLMRYYLPLIHRWLNRDPIEEDGGINLYGFCRNSPLFFFDDFGGEFRFAGDPKDNDGRYIALWGPNSGTFSVKWVYEGSDCCETEISTKSYGPLFFNNTGDPYYPIWNVETIEENMELPRSKAIGTDLESGASPASGAWGDKGSLTITITWTPAQVPETASMNSPNNTDYWKHGAAWNLPNHFPWTDKPFSPFSGDGQIGTSVGGKETVVIVSSWNNCKGIKHNVKGHTVSGAALKHGNERSRKRR